MSPPLPADLLTALRAVARTERLLVASDFDGVLAPFVVDPMAARPQDGTIDALRELARLRRTDAALVSGRDLRTLAQLTGVDGQTMTLVGSHGAESSRGAGVPLDDGAVAQLTATTAWVTSELARRSAGVRLEHKPGAVVLHTRGLGAVDAAVAEMVAEEAGQGPGVRLLRGKDVLELSVVVADKGSALMALAADLGSDALVYLGDDRTDEDVFEVARPADVTIKVGAGQSSARYRLAGCEDVPAVLVELVRLRRDATRR